MKEDQKLKPITMKIEANNRKMNDENTNQRSEQTRKELLKGNQTMQNYYTGKEFNYC